MCRLLYTSHPFKPVPMGLCFSIILECSFSFCCVFVSVYLRAVGGEVGATSSLAPKIGPLGLVRFNCEILPYEIVVM